MQHTFTLSFSKLMSILALVLTAGTLAAQCPNNLNSTNAGFEEGTLNDFSDYGNSGVAITSNVGEVINGTYSATVQNDDALLKFYFGSITEGNEYSATILTNEAVSGGYAQIQIQWFADNGSGGTGPQIGSNINGMYVPNGTSTLTETAPAGALHAQIIFQAGGGTVVVVDDFCMEEVVDPSNLFECPGNLVTNGDFETGTGGYYSFNGAIIDGTTDAATGMGAAVVPIGGEVATNFTAGVVPGNFISFGGALKSADASFVIEFRNENNGTSAFSGTGAVSDPANYARVTNDTETVPEGTTLIQVWARSLTNEMAVVDDICVLDLGPDPNFTFPITLSSFTGEVKAKTNQLNWTTATEENTAMFYLERSPDGLGDWEEVTTVTAAGNSQTELDYIAEDPRPYGQTYYRLRSVDFDGSFQLSNLVMLERASEQRLLAYPNPFANQLVITTDLEQAADYQLIDALGRRMNSGRIAAGVQTTTLSTEQLPSGRYLVRVGEDSFTVIK